MRTVATRVERTAIARILGDAEKARPIGARGRAARSKRRTVARPWDPDKEAARRDDPAAYNRQVFLSTREAAAFLNTSPRMLNRYRSNGEGPAYCKSGQRVLYARADLLAWAWTRRRRTTESD